MKHFRTLIAIIIGGYVFFTAFFILQRVYFPTQILQQQSEEVQTLSNQTGMQKQQLDDGVGEQQNKERIEVPEVVQGINTLLKVPFTSQAPTGNWDNPIFQNACEEASVYMAMLWVKGKQTTSLEAEKVMIAMSNFEQKNYGVFLDTSAADTAQFMRDYFKYQNVFLKSDISVNDIKNELVRGNLVIVPVDGRALRNPFYTPPGPERHMLVIRGYDAKKKVLLPMTRELAGGKHISILKKYLEERFATILAVITSQLRK